MSHSQPRLLRFTTIAIALSTAVLALTLTRCGKAPGTPASGTFGSVFSTIQTANCAQCHVPGGASNGSTLDFTSSQTAYNTLTTNKVTGGSSVGICGNVKIVVAGSAATSYLAAVLFSDMDHTNFGQTGCTPYNVHHSDQHLSTDEETSFVNWINAGAQNN